VCGLNREAESQSWRQQRSALAERRVDQVLCYGCEVMSRDIHMDKVWNIKKEENIDRLQEQIKEFLLE
jgi:hypothetical protein